MVAVAFWALLWGGRSVLVVGGFVVERSVSVGSMGDFRRLVVFRF